MTAYTCDDKETLVAYLYGEVDAAARKGVEAHLATCAACAAEVAALRDVRAELGLWMPPDAELGFKIVQQSGARVLRPAAWWQTVPAWARAAAAVLVLAAGAAIANVQVRSGPDGLTVSTGWMAVPAAAPAPGEPFDGEAVERRVERALVTLEQQLRSEIRSSRDQDATRAAAATADEATIRRVQQLLAESEQRQERELALRFTQFTRDMNMQRRADLMRITNSFGDFDQRMLQQRQMLNNVMRVSATPQQ